MEVGAAGVTEQGGVAAAAAAGPRGGGALWGAASNARVGGVSLLQAEAGGARDGADGEGTLTEAVEAHVAEGKKGLALTFRDEATTGGGGAAGPSGRGLDKADEDESSDALLVKELGCEEGRRGSVGLGLFRAAAAGEEVLVTGVVV